MTPKLEALHKEAVQKIGYMPDIKYWLIRAYDLGEKAHNQDMMSEVEEKLEGMKYQIHTGTAEFQMAEYFRKQGYDSARTEAQTIIKSLEHQDMSELDQDCPYCDIHSCCSIHADNQKPLSNQPPPSSRM